MFFGGIVLSIVLSTIYPVHLLNTEIEISPSFRFSFCDFICLFLRKMAQKLSKIIGFGTKFTRIVSQSRMVEDTSGCGTA
jgi:hypothetical protein